MNQGVYALIIQNKKEQQIQIGKLGKFSFSEGFYLYIGSALGKTATNLENRLKRHLSSNKKLFWHIDFLLNSESIEILTIIYAYTSEPKECSLGSKVSQLENAEILVPKFGASDCKGKCGSHLFYFRNKKNKIISLVESTFQKINLTPILRDTSQGELAL